MNEATAFPMLNQHCIEHSNVFIKSQYHERSSLRHTHAVMMLKSGASLKSARTFGA
ncbi:hypothetical protein [Priestia flexa]|uniref:hypothetical protein n=1 Tax=Priestia flexa TaxID=86664 RepID=UPI003D2EB95B